MVPVEKRGQPKRRGIIVALVTSLWKSSKKPKLLTSACQLSHVIAFRCIELHGRDECVSLFEATESSMPWVLKPEAIVAILAPASQEAIDLGTESMKVRLSGESIQLLDTLATAAQWWPTPADEPQGKEGQGSALAGVFISRRRKRGRGAAPLGQQAKVAKIGKSLAAGVKTKKNKSEKKKKKKSEKKESKKSKKASLKKAAADKKIELSVENCRRNGAGPLLVKQMMVQFRNMEAAKFSTQALSFNSGGECQVKHEKCKNVMWEAVQDGAHSYFCAECLGHVVWESRLRKACFQFF